MFRMVQLDIHSFDSRQIRPGPSEHIPHHQRPESEDKPLSQPKNSKDCCPHVERQQAPPPTPRTHAGGRHQRGDFRGGGRALQLHKVHQEAQRGRQQFQAVQEQTQRTGRRGGDQRTGICGAPAQL